MKKKLPFTIAISGVSGAGKTMTTMGLINKLYNSHAFYFDAYNFKNPKKIINWMYGLADCNQWDLTNLIEDLKKPDTQLFNYIVLDFPFSYKHLEISKFIDLAVFIDIPIDMAITRRLKRNPQAPPIDSKVYTEVINTIKPISDIIIDGRQSVSTIINQIHEQVT